MKWLVENWFILVAFLSLTGGGIYAAAKFFGLPAHEQTRRIRTWLLWAVTQAENDLGNGTGQLKLAKVYDLFLKRFGVLALIISFDTFNRLVDAALAEMRILLENDTRI